MTPTIDFIPTPEECAKLRAQLAEEFPHLTIISVEYVHGGDLVIEAIGYEAGVKAASEATATAPAA